MRRIAILVIGSLALAACSLAGEAGSGVLTTRDVVLAGDIDAVEIDDAFEAVLHVGAPAAEASITIDDNLTDLLDVRQDGSTLVVGLSGNVRDATLVADISLPSLAAVSADGASTITIDGELETDEVSFETSGASSLDATAIRADRLEIRASGASHLRIAGETGDLDAEASGASKLELQSLAADDGRIQVSGASSADVDVRDQLEVDASGASTVHYQGSPDLSVESSGSSTVEPA
jgi:putative autotransporter adhesin-like protein